AADHPGRIFYPRGGDPVCVRRAVAAVGGPVPDGAVLDPARVTAPEIRFRRSCLFGRRGRLGGGLLPSKPPPTVLSPEVAARSSGGRQRLLGRSSLRLADKPIGL